MATYQMISLGFIQLYRIDIAPMRFQDAVVVSPLLGIQPLRHHTVLDLLLTALMVTYPRRSPLLHQSI
jgi:hypothetical protein